MKLIRDKIPDIARKKGEVMQVRIASEEEYRVLLHRKLMEELAEYLESREHEELADLFEVVRALAEVLNVTAQRLFGRRKTTQMKPASSTSVEGAHELLYGVVLDFIQKKDVESLIGVVDALREVMRRRHISHIYVLRLRDKKRRNRGGFEGRVVWCSPVTE